MTSDARVRVRGRGRGRGAGVRGREAGAGGQRSGLSHRIAGFLVLGVLWEVAARLLTVPVFSPLSRVLAVLWQILTSGTALAHIMASLSHICVGFGMAAVVGFLLGVLMSQSVVVRTLLMPVVDSVRPVAALTLFPLLIVLFGLGLWSRAVVIFWTAWPAILLSTIQSIRQVDRSVLEAAALDGVGGWRTLAAITLPLASPGILTGLRIGMGGGWISLVSAEMLGASEGLGYLVLSSSQTFKFPTMYAAILLIALIGLAMNSVLGWIQSLLEKRVLEGTTSSSPF